MIIQFLGLTCFKLQTKHNEDISVIVNPPSSSSGVVFEKQATDILLLSHQKSLLVDEKAIIGGCFRIDCAGEYDLKEVGIKGVESKGIEGGHNVIYRITMNDISVVHLGLPSQELELEQIEAIDGVDILIVPVGGGESFDAKKAWAAVEKLEPRIIIPMNYKMEGLSVDLNGVDEFVKISGLAPRYEDKLKITKKDLPQEDTELIILK